MRTMLVCFLLLLAGAAFASSVTISVPDAQDATVVAAKDAYNARTGQTLTVKQWILQVTRAEVIAELAQQQETAAAVSVKAAQAALDAANAAAAAQVKQTIDANSTDTWALPPTPKPTPVPTPTVPVMP